MPSRSGGREHASERRAGSPPRLLPLALVLTLGAAAPTVQPSATPGLSEPLFDLLLVFEEERVAEGRRALDVLGGTDRIDLQALPITRVILDTRGVSLLHTLPFLAGVEDNALVSYYLDDSVPAIGAPVAWQTGERGANATVMVIDTGIDATHPDFVGAVKDIAIPFAGPGGTLPVLGPGSLGAGPLVTDTVGHGTHVASTILGRGNVPMPSNDPSQGLPVHYRGVAPEARLVAFGIGAADRVIGVLQGFDYAVQHPELGIRVISNSWGRSPSSSFAGATATRMAYEAGIVVVFAAGNAGPGQGTMNPYSLPPWVLSVGATTKDRVLGGFSSRGVAGMPTYVRPDLSAPGIAILAAKSSIGWLQALGPAYCGAGEEGSTLWPPTIVAGQSPQTVAAETLYQCLSGTSMATPHVSGAAALVLSANPALTPDQVMDILVSSADALPYAIHDAGTGFLNASRAVELARSTPGELAGFLAGARRYAPSPLNDNAMNLSRDAAYNHYYALHPYLAFENPASGAVIGPATPKVSVRLFSLGGRAPVEVEAAIDGGKLRRVEAIGDDRYAEEWALASLDDGPHAIRAWAMTPEGTTEIVRTVTVDKRPICKILSPASGATLRGSVAFTAQAFTALAEIASVEVLHNGTRVATLTDPEGDGDYTGPVDTLLVPDGSVLLSARCTDADGRSRSVSRSYRVANGPDVRIVSPSASSEVSGAVEVAVEVDSPRGPPQAVFFSADDGPEEEITASFDGSRYRALWESGRHTREDVSAKLAARAVDPAGTSRSASIGVTVDNRPDPSVEIVDPLEDETVAGFKRVVVAASSGVGASPTVLLGINARPWVDITASRDGDRYHYDWTLAAFEPERTVVRARAVDEGGGSEEARRVTVRGYPWAHDTVRDAPGVKETLDYYECLQEHGVFGPYYGIDPHEIARRWGEAIESCQIDWR